MSDFSVATTSLATVAADPASDKISNPRDVTEGKKDVDVDVCE